MLGEEKAQCSKQTHPTQKLCSSRPEAVSVPRALSGASVKRVREVKAGMALETVWEGPGLQGCSLVHRAPDKGSCGLPTSHSTASSTFLFEL